MSSSAPPIVWCFVVVGRGAAVRFPKAAVRAPGRRWPMQRLRTLPPSKRWAGWNLSPAGLDTTWRTRADGHGGCGCVGRWVGDATAGGVGTQPGGSAAEGAEARGLECGGRLPGASRPRRQCPGGRGPRPARSAARRAGWPRGRAPLGGPLSRRSANRGFGDTRAGCVGDSARRTSAAAAGQCRECREGRAATGEKGGETPARLGEREAEDASEVLDALGELALGGGGGGDGVRGRLRPGACADRAGLWRVSVVAGGERGMEEKGRRKRGARRGRGSSLRRPGRI